MVVLGRFCGNVPFSGCLLRILPTETHSLAFRQYRRGEQCSSAENPQDSRIISGTIPFFSPYGDGFCLTKSTDDQWSPLRYTVCRFFCNLCFRFCQTKRTAPAAPPISNSIRRAETSDSPPKENDPWRFRQQSSRVISIQFWYLTSLFTSLSAGSDMGFKMASDKTCKLGGFLPMSVLALIVLGAGYLPVHWYHLFVLKS